MKQLLLACAIAAGMSVATVDAQAARGDGHRGGNWSGGGHGSWSGTHGSRGNWSGNHGNWRGSHGNWNRGHGNWGGHRWHGGHWRGFGYSSIYLGWPYWWGPAYYDYPAYTYYDAPAYYDSTEVYVEPPVTTAPAAPRAQYYCPDTGYYPTVQACPRGWLRVLPGDAPPR